MEVNPYIKIEKRNSADIKAKVAKEKEGQQTSYEHKLVSRGRENSLLNTKVSITRVKRLVIWTEYKMTSEKTWMNLLRQSQAFLL